ncbi:MAG: imidazole glycerol phosphate synthase subunit HisF [Balneolaceae bacterium]|nr:imidazole glycerol phosphate synthase subunit HisF [Balneolaceae bacterium]
MLKKRIIPCLDIKDGRTVKGIRFVDIQDAGDPVQQAEAYSLAGADELVFLDISATVEKRKTLAELVERIAETIQIPFTVGGGIQSVEDAKRLLDAGADKISVNSAAVRRPELISELADKLGGQCVVVAMDVKHNPEEAFAWNIVVDGGRTWTEIDAFEWARQAERRGAGELLCTSMDHDGTKSGYDIGFLQSLRQKVSIPIIASGGAGTPEHFAEVFDEGRADAALAASLFHFGELEIPTLKQFLKTKGFPIR